jgi:SAM-dependent methyltransferase
MKSENSKENSPQFWEERYLSNTTGWDLNGATPVFKNLAEALVKGKVCILGCGRGYDAIMLAEKGFEVTAVDFAPSATNALESNARKESKTINILQRDIFSLTDEFKDHFDYVIEQTCFCAIHPNRRMDYVGLVENILKVNGKLIGLWFPLDKNLEEGGPPYGVTENQIKSYFKVNWTIEKEEFSKLSIESRKNREKLIIFKKI